MRTTRSNVFVRLIGRLAGLQVRRQPGQVVVYSALLLTVLMGLAGAGVDYGLIVIESAKLQNALDAAALAGARGLVTASSQGTQDATGEAAAANFLALQGYTNGVNGATFTYSEAAQDGGAWHDTMTIVGTVAKPTSFWKIIGINTTTLNQRATAAAGAGMVDVMISLDLSGSMQLSGTNDLTNLRSALVAFVNQMHITSGDPRGSQVGIARWAGVNCSWYRGNTLRAGTPTPTTHPDGDTLIDFGTGRSVGGSDPDGEYTTPCYDDATVLSYLSQDSATLTKIADNSGAGTCPSAPAGPATPTAYSPASMSNYGCPMQSWIYPYNMVPVTYGTPTTATGVQNHTWNGMTGTKLSNALKIVNGNTTGCYAWASSTTACPTNGRNNAMTSEGLARKVLVIMTDGFSEVGGEGLPTGYPTYSGQSAPSSWDTEAMDLVTALKKGPDGDITTTNDNVEIYVVGFYCNNSTASSTAQSLGWCSSNLAVTSSPHPCPGATWPTTSPAPSSTDTLLRTISSSTTGTCDHYFPIQKTESLPQLFRVMAGSIARGRLQ
jgi:Flp pilus assembly protein TadG